MTTISSGEPPNNIIDEMSYWRWAYSDHLSNSQRGALAEYIVGQAIGVTQKPRVQWDRYDLVSPEGIAVEVKSAAYVQSWEQPKLSEISFDIAPKLWWDAETNTYATEKSRSSMVYVFCVLGEQDRAKVNPLDLGQWFFFVASTKQLNEWFKEQKSVRMSMLEKNGLERVWFADLREQVLRLGR